MPDSPIAWTRLSEYGEAGLWHVMHDDRPGTGLCGARLTGTYLSSHTPGTRCLACQARLSLGWVKSS